MSKKIQQLEYLIYIGRYARSVEDPSTFYRATDARVIPREEQLRAERLYRERCAQQS